MEEKKRRTDNIYSVTVAKYATMHIEAETEEEAVAYAKEHCNEVDPWNFEDSVSVDSWETSANQAEDYMEEIWIEDGKTLTYDEYKEALEEQGDLEALGGLNIKYGMY